MIDILFYIILIILFFLLIDQYLLEKYIDNYENYYKTINETFEDNTDKIINTDDKIDETIDENINIDEQIDENIDENINTGEQINENIEENIDENIEENIEENMDETELRNHEKDIDFLNFIKQQIYHDENDKIIDHLKFEIEEQYQAYKYIKEDDIVLELGGRYGTVSVLINKILNNKTNHVVVEPDTTIIHALEKNRNNNDCNFHIVNKFISNTPKKIYFDGYSTRIISDENDIIDNPDEKPEDKLINDKKRFLIDDTGQNFSVSYDKFKKLYPLNFNVLVADCEGCLCDFFNMIGDDLDNFNKIIFEADQETLCNYVNIIDLLTNHGFIEIDNSFNVVNRYVFIK